MRPFIQFCHCLVFGIFFTHTKKKYIHIYNYKLLLLIILKTVIRLTYVITLT